MVEETLLDCLVQREGVWLAPTNLMRNQFFHLLSQQEKNKNNNNNNKKKVN